MLKNLKIQNNIVTNVSHSTHLFFVFQQYRNSTYTAKFFCKSWILLM